MGADWADEHTVRRWTERVLEAAGTAVPGLRERLLWHEAHTPRQTAQETGTPRGEVPAPALAAAGGRFLRPANTTRLPGLYRVGGGRTRAADCPTRACRARWWPG